MWSGKFDGICRSLALVVLAFTTAVFADSRNDLSSFLDHPQLQFMHCSTAADSNRFDGQLLRTITGSLPEHSWSPRTPAPISTLAQPLSKDVTLEPWMNEQRSVGVRVNVTW
jgi:hypothetical protein